MNTTTTTIIQESMNLYQVFATGGASALAVVALLATLKFLQSRHHIISKCTSEGMMRFIAISIFALGSM